MIKGGCGYITACDGNGYSSIGIVGSGFFCPEVGSDIYGADLEESWLVGVAGVPV